ncbi:methylated-DNA--[protein]-cysteine S-methyltransferase [Oceanithermus sp.]
MTAWGYFASPVGLIRVAASTAGLVEARLAGAPSHEETGPGWEHVLAFFDFAESYFRGRRPEWQGILDLSGHKPSQIRLWEAVMQIPYGQTVSYADLGRQLGIHPRSVGAGMRKTPVLLVIPAHRVIHADGRVGGFAGFEGVKQQLLDFEKRTLSR